MSFEQQAAAWRLHREEHLKREFGWLSLAGLFFLSEGDNPAGPDGPVTVPRAPGIVGSFVLDDGRVRFVTPEGLWWPLTGDQEGAEPSVLRWGDVSLTLVWRQDRWAVRLRDNQAATRTGFRGLDWYAPDPAWAVAGRWEPFDPPRTVTIRNVLGHESSQEFHGQAVVPTPAGPLVLWGQREASGAVFFNFRDQTSGQTTYGAGRFLDATPADGAVTLDFNRAYNPPCAFTPFATCPLPPPENRLAVPVTAGEKLPPGGPAH
jgi:uncharacterized protein (DUF1684 family)